MEPCVAVMWLGGAEPSSLPGKGQSAPLLFYKEEGGDCMAVCFSSGKHCSPLMYLLWKALNAM